MSLGKRRPPPKGGHYELDLAAEVFTTGQIAQIVSCAPRTVVKWCNEGHLSCMRLPGKGDRRIARCDLLRFLRREGMQHAVDKLTGALPPEPVSCLLAGVPTHLEERLRSLLGARCRVTVAPTLFSLGMALRDPPRAAVVDLAVGADRNEVRGAVTRLVEECSVVVVLLGEDDPEPVRVAYQGGVFGGVHLVWHPVDADAVARLILGEGDA